MKPIKISAVCYYNTLPFIYGIKRSGLLTNYELSLDIPAECARKLIEGESDVSLIPVGALTALPGYHLIGNHCIGAVHDVKSVLLLANDPVESLKTIFLDTHSRTSVRLVRLLAKKLWHIMPEWKSIDALQHEIKPGEGKLLIGDKTFGLSKIYSHTYDLAGEWIRLTGLPFVFAVWASTRKLEPELCRQLENALAWGVAHRKRSVMMAIEPKISEAELIDYLENDISFELDAAKKEGLNLFLNFVNEDPDL